MRYLKDILIGLSIPALIALGVWLQALGVWWIAGAAAQQMQPQPAAVQEAQLVQNLTDSKRAVDTVLRGMWNDILVMFNNQQQELNKERDAVAWWAGCVKDQVCVEWAKGAPK